MVPLTPRKLPEATPPAQGTQIEMKRSFDGLVLLGMALFAGLVVFYAALMYRNVSQLDGDLEMVVHTHEVRALIGEVMLALDDAGTGQRGYLITGRDAFLGPYKNSEQRLSGIFARLRDETRDNPRQKQDLSALEDLAKSRILSLNTGVRLRQQQDAVALQQFMLDGTGLQQMNAIRALVARLDREEQALLVVRKETSADTIRMAKNSGALITVLGLALLGAFFFVIRRSLVDRQRASALVQEIGERFRVTLGSIGDAVVATDPHGRITFMNAIAEQLSGWPLAEARGLLLPEVLDILNESDHQPAENPALRAMREGGAVGLLDHTVLVSRDGTERPIDDSAAPIRGASGGVVGSVMVFRDVSEHRKAELERAEHDRLTALRVDIGSFLAANLGAPVALQSCVEALVRHLGAAFAGIWILEEFEPTLVLEASSGTLAGGNPPHERTPLGETEIGRIARDHAPFWTNDAFSDPGMSHSEWLRAEGLVAFAGYPLVAGGKALGVLAVFARGPILAPAVAEFFPILAGLAQYIERERVQDALHTVDLTNRFLLRASTALASLVDFESTLQKVARMAVPSYADWCAVDVMEPDGTLRRLVVAHKDPEKVGLAREMDLQYPLSFDAPNCPPKVMRTHRRELVSQVTDSMLIGLARDEAHLQFLRQLKLRSFICVPLRAAGATIGAITFATAESGRRYGPLDVVVAEDLALRASVAIDNAHLYRNMKEGDQRKDEFLAVLSHELRNPLAALRNGVEIMRQIGLENPRLREVRDIQERQVNQIARLVDDLLDVARIRQGKVTLQTEPTDLAGAVHRAVELCRVSIETGNHQLTLSLPPEPVRIEADPVRLVQIIANLLTNAAKYTHDGGKLRLSAGREGDQAVIRIQDNGVGIDSMMLNKVFELFAQIENGRSKDGLGVGLSLVRSLVEMHGGSVVAVSGGLGAGSEFVVRLPVLHLYSPGSAGARPSVAAETRPPRRVLVVDDNKDSALTLRMSLELSGHAVSVAHEGASGLKLARELLPDAIILDIGLPGMDGYDVARKIRSTPELSGVFLVAMTGYGQEEDKRRSRVAGFDAHLTKPVDLAVLLGLLEEMPVR